MKRLIGLFLAAATLLCACAPTLENEKKETELSQEELMRTEGKYLDAAGKEIPLENITPDNWYKVQLTYPVDFISDADLETYKSEYEKVTVDENNRATVVMSKEQYENLKTSCEISIQEDFSACMDGTLNNVLPNIAEIKADDLYEEVQVLISGDASREQITPFAYILCKDLYRFKTLVGNNAQTTVVIMDKDTGAVYGEFNDVQLYEYEHKEKADNGTEK